MHSSNFVNGLARIADGLCLVTTLGCYCPQLARKHNLRVSKQHFERVASTPLRFCALTGRLLAIPYSRYSSADVWVYNPYTGEKRAAADFEIDPHGKYCLPD